MLNSALDFPREAKVLEMGCASFPSILALGESLRLWNEYGADNIQRRVRLLTRLLRDKLREADFAVPERPLDELSGITIVPMANAEQVSEALMRQRIAQAPRGSGIRLAVHAFNNEEDLDRAVEALREQRMRPG
jgi:selenocysteine lyase/cysteine desulfurase